MICVQTLCVLAMSSRIMTPNSEKIVRYSFWGVSCDILHLWFLKTWTNGRIITTNLLSTIWHHADNYDGIFIRKNFTQWIAESCILISLIYATWGIKYFWLICFRKKKCSLKIRPNPLPIVTPLWPSLLWDHVLDKFESTLPVKKSTSYKFVLPSWFFIRKYAKLQTHFP